MYRKIIFSLLIAVLLCTVFAEEAQKLNMDKQKLRMLPTEQHNIRALISNERDCILFVNEFTVASQDVNSGELISFFLNKDMKIDALFMADQGMALYKIENIKAEYFQPRLRLQQLVDISELSQVYSFYVPQLSSMPDTLRFRLSYNIPLCDAIKYSKNEDKSITFAGDNFWYPRHIYKDHRVSLQVSSPQGHRIFINDIELERESRAVRLSHQIVFIDRNEQPASITFEQP